MGGNSSELRRESLNYHLINSSDDTMQLVTGILRSSTRWHSSASGAVHGGRDTPIETQLLKQCLKYVPAGAPSCSYYRGGGQTRSSYSERDVKPVDIALTNWDVACDNHLPLLPHRGVKSWAHKRGRAAQS